MDVRQEIGQLTRELEHANHLYYVLDAPEMPDYEYDRKLRRLEELEAAHPEYASPLSPTRRVGGEAVSAFQKVRHAVPLESLQDVFPSKNSRNLTPASARPSRMPFTASSRRLTAFRWRLNTLRASLSAARRAATALSART